MIVDIEITLNRFGFGKISKNKFQLGFLRFSLWRDIPKHAICVEINWKKKNV